MRALFVPPAQNFRVVDGMRALSILWVIALHSVWNLAFNIDRTAYIDHLTSPFFHLALQGEFGVNVFFVISGFLVSHFLMNEHKAAGSVDIKRFYVRRALRLLPAYYVVLGVQCLLKSEKAGTVWANLLYVNNFIPATEQVMTWAWSLAIEEQFYIVFPPFLLLLLWMRRGRLALFGGLLALALAIRAALFWKSGIRLPFDFDGGATNAFDEFLRFEDVVYFKPYARYGSLLLGVAVAYVYYYTGFAATFAARRAVRYGINLVGAVLLAGSLLVPRLLVDGVRPGAARWLDSTFANLSYAAAYDLTFSIGLAIVLWNLLTVAKGSWLARGLSARVLYPIGQLAYSAYLVNPLLGTRLFKLTEPRSTSLWVLAGHVASVMVVTLLVAAVLYLVIERPFMNLRHHGATEPKPVDLGNRVVVAPQSGVA